MLNRLSKYVGKCVGKCVGTTPGAPRESGASEGPSPYGGTDTLDELNAVRRPSASQGAADRSPQASRVGVDVDQLIERLADLPSHWTQRKCEACQVRWVGEPECWMCGRAA